MVREVFLKPKLFQIKVTYFKVFVPKLSSKELTGLSTLSSIFELLIGVRFSIDRRVPTIGSWQTNYIRKRTIINKASFGGGIVVSIYIFCYEDPSLNPANAFLVKCVWESVWTDVYIKSCPYFLKLSQK